MLARHAAKAWLSGSSKPTCVSTLRHRHLAPAFAPAAASAATSFFSQHLSQQQQQQQHRQLRLFSSHSDRGWKVPSGLYIPEEHLDLSYVRSSGSGGQNVNKVNSQVQIKLKLGSTCHWIPHEVQQRLKEQQRNRINKEGELILHVQEHRAQIQNKKAAIDKLRDLILRAWARPKVRKMRKGLSKETKERYREDKRRKSMKKESRRRVEF